MPATATMKAMSPSDIRVIANMDAKRSTLPALARSSDYLLRNCSNPRTGVLLQRPVYRRRLVVALGGGWAEGERGAGREVRGGRGEGSGEKSGTGRGSGCGERRGLGVLGQGRVGRGVVRQAQQGRQVRFGGWLPLDPGRGDDGGGGG